MTFDVKQLLWAVYDIRVVSGVSAERLQNDALGSSVFSGLEYAAQALSGSPQAALIHHYVLRDNTLKLMSFGRA